MLEKIKTKYLNFHSKTTQKKFKNSINSGMKKIINNVTKMFLTFKTITYSVLYLIK